MKNLSKLQFELLNLAIILLPFIYLGLAWKESSEAKLTVHTGLYYAIGSVLLIYFMAMIIDVIDSNRANKENFIVNSRIMRIILTVSAAIYGFIIFPNMLEFQANKHNDNQFLLIWMSITMIIGGNYQARVKPNSAYNGLLLHFFGEDVQTKNNRYQARVLVALGIISLLFFSLPMKISKENTMIFFSSLVMIGLLSAFLYAVLSTPKSLRFKTKKTI
jgi:hypothetical protein